MQSSSATYWPAGKERTPPEPSGASFTWWKRWTVRQVALCSSSFGGRVQAGSLGGSAGLLLLVLVVVVVLGGSMFVSRTQAISSWKQGDTTQVLRENEGEKKGAILATRQTDGRTCGC